MTDAASLCAACENTGWEPVPEKDRTVRHCSACEYWDRVRGSAPGIPEAERGATLENFEPNAYNAAAIRHARTFVEGVHQGFYLHGPVGTGKTRLVCSILNDLWKAGTRVRFMRVPELMIRLTPSTSDEDDAAGLIADLTAVPVLCLDDIGATAGTDYTRRMVQVLADARADRGHRTIWTSNLDPDDLAEYLSDTRITSRIHGDCRIVELGGLDQRRTRERKTAKPARKPFRKDTTNHGKASRW
jgi:DNA replication protein DnaC